MKVEKTRMRAFVKMIIPPILLPLVLRVYHFCNCRSKKSGMKMQDELIIEVNKKFPGELIKCSKVGFHERIYRNMKYIIFEDVVCPAHVSNFKFLEYLMKEVVKGGGMIYLICVLVRVGWVYPYYAKETFGLLCSLILIIRLFAL